MDLSKIKPVLGGLPAFCLRVAVVILFKLSIEFIQYANKDKKYEVETIPFTFIEKIALPIILLLE
jgi:hypothetical protein